MPWDFGGQKDDFGKNWKLAYNGIMAYNIKNTRRAPALGPQWNDFVA
jgi:hypothetical protein